MKLYYLSNRLEKSVNSLMAIAKKYGNRAKIVNQYLLKKTEVLTGKM